MSNKKFGKYLFVSSILYSFKLKYLIYKSVLKWNK